MLKFARGTCIAIVASAALSACAGGSSALQPPLSAAPSVAQRVTLPDAVPPKCSGQTSTTAFAHASESLWAKGGSLCVPVFRGLGGTLAYPRANPAGPVQVTSSTTNYNNQIPTLGKDTAVFFLQFTTTAPVDFAKLFHIRGGLTGRTIVAGKPYTVFGNAELEGVNRIVIPFKTCSTVATSGRYGGVIAPWGTLLDNANITGPATVTIEVYTKTQTATKC